MWLQTYYSRQAKRLPQAIRSCITNISTLLGVKGLVGLYSERSQRKRNQFGPRPERWYGRNFEISVPDVLIYLSDTTTNPDFQAGLWTAKKRNSSDFLTVFKQEFERIDPNARLSTIFSTLALKRKIRLDMKTTK